MTILIYPVRTQYLQSPNPFAPDRERLGLVVLHISTFSIAYLEATSRLSPEVWTCCVTNLSSSVIWEQSYEINNYVEAESTLSYTFYFTSLKAGFCLI